MSSDPTGDPRSTAIDVLEKLGLSSYAARTYVALASLGTATATDVSDVADVPRTRVYGAADELAEHGLVDVQHSSPKEFRAVSAETTGRKFEAMYNERTARLTEALGDLEPAHRSSEQRGVWTVTGEETVTDRVLEFFDAADEEIVYMTVDEILTDRVMAALEDAADRGVTIKLGGTSAAVMERVEDQIPGVEAFDSLWLWSDTPAGRLVLVDREQTLVSVLVDNGGPAGRSETAIWGSGEANSLVVVLKGIFAWRLGETDDE